LGDRFPTTALADVLECNGAQVIARHVHGFYAGKPAVTLNHYGQGRVIYLGVLSDGAFYDALACWLSDLAGIQTLETPTGVEVAVRWQGEQSITFILNHTAQPQTLTLDAPRANLLDDRQIAGEVHIDGHGVLILQ
jgi:beta-galactosidase